jgi:hypothetical protein
MDEVVVHQIWMIIQAIYVERGVNKFRQHYELIGK